MSLHVSLPILRDADDWKWQIRNSVRDAEGLKKYLVLTEDEEIGLQQAAEKGELPTGITPHYLSLMDPQNPQDPLRRQLIPHRDEWIPTSWDLRDPLGEEEREVVPFLVHRYPDRVLLLATDRCASYCRFCTRKRMVGQGPTPTLDHLLPALEYIQSHPEIHEVIVSGGDALMLSDDRLLSLITQIREIKHIDVIRLATRMLAFAPQRITKELLGKLQEHHPIYILSHFNHPHEISEQSKKAITMLINHGFPILNQTVLLRGINDHSDILAKLFRSLNVLRVRPYYLHQCDLAPGTNHFRVPLEQAISILASLRGHISGLCMPTFVIDIPGGLGKVPLVPEAIVGGDAESVLLRGFRGDTASYPRI